MKASERRKEVGKAGGDGVNELEIFCSMRYFDSYTSRLFTKISGEAVKKAFGLEAAIAQPPKATNEKSPGSKSQFRAILGWRSRGCHPQLPVHLTFVELVPVLGETLR